MLRSAFLRRTLTGLLSFLLTFEPLVANRMFIQAAATALPYAIPALILKEAFSSAEALAAPIVPGAADGEAAGKASLDGLLAPGKFPTQNPAQTQVTLPTVNNTTMTTSGEVIQNRNEQSGDQAVVASSVNSGNDDDYDQLVGDVTTRISTENSNQGEAYRTMMDSRAYRPNYKDAHFLDRTKVVQNDTETFSGCTQTETTVSSPVQYTFTDEQHCTRVENSLQNCHVKRNYVLHPPPVTGDVAYNGPSSLKTSYEFGGQGGGIHYDTKSFSVSDWTKIQSVVVTYMHCDDHCAFEVNSGSGWVRILPTSSHGSNIGCSETNQSNPWIPEWMGTVNITPYVYGMNNFSIRMNLCVSDKGGGTGTIIWNASTTFYEDKGFIENPPGCWSKQYANAFCHADNWTCTDNSTKYAGGVIVDLDTVKSGGGKAIWSDATPYENTAFEGTNVCWEADGTGLCNFNTGTIGCFTDVQGNTQCPQNDGTTEQNDCQELIDKGCVWKAEECLEGAYDAGSGTCMVFTEIYDCGGESVQITGEVQTTTQINCGATRCMGEECMTPVDEHNSSFGAVAGLMGNVGSMGQDGTCDENGCKLFVGKEIKCKIALGGMFNCCNKNIEGVNWVDYVKTAYQAYKAAQQSGWISASSSSGSTSGIATQVVNGALTTVDSLFGTELVSGYESLASSASSYMASLAQEALAATYDWVASTFSEEVAAALIEKTVVNGATQYGISSGAAAAVGAVLTVLIWLYVIYLILTIIFACDDDEFELAAEKQMKACHYVGSYCASKSLGACWEKKETWCCYGSALSRIMQEQVRKQIYGWGTPENPKCEGLTTNDLQAVDWKQVDLSEYTAMLTVAGIRPEGGQEGNYYQMDNISKVNIGGTNQDPGRGDSSGGVNVVDNINNATGISGGGTFDPDKIRTDAVDTSSYNGP